MIVSSASMLSALFVARGCAVAALKEDEDAVADCRVDGVAAFDAFDAAGSDVGEGARRWYIVPILVLLESAIFACLPPVGAVENE
jgi:hypothetical protein